MQPRRIDGIYARESMRRPELERRVVVPARANVTATPQAPVESMLPRPTPPPSIEVAVSVDERSVVSNLPDVVEQPAPPVKRNKKRLIAIVAYSALIVGILVITGILGYNTWMTNEHARAEFSKDVAPQQSVGAGQIADVTPPSEAAVSDATKESYSVAADMPRMIHIDRINVHARVLRMSVTSSGAIQAPAGIWDVGWYDGSAKPGEPGTTFIDGHVSGPTMDAVFVKLKVLRAGDYITIERGDGSKITYIVKTVSTNKLEDIDMKQVLASPGSDKQQLTLMTCGGNYQGNYTYDGRVVVTAERVS